MGNSKHQDVVDQLDQFYEQAKRQILQYQSAITGLFPSNSAENSDASIRTSLWAASSIFALYLAYSKRIDNDQGKAHDLGQSVVKCMRGILFAWMRQSESVEMFKANQSPKHALHLKFDLHSGLANDFDYPHLQLDVVSLYLIFLANFIASGLDIIYCMDEVTFIQNLVYYVERAYRTPDYGNWEPTETSVNQRRYMGPQSANLGLQASYDPKANIPHTSTSQTNSSHRHSTQQQQFFNPHATNQNIAHQSTKLPVVAPWISQYSSQISHGKSLEIHATSIGMAKSALEAINGCNLFGGKGANWSIIYSDIDAHSRNRSIFETMLPRESRSKNTDSYLLATIGWPCFATHDPNLYESTKSKILRKLQGKYGLKRFLRDPYGTVIESEVFERSLSNVTVETVNMNSAHQQTPQTASFNRAESFSSTNSSPGTSLGEPPKSKQRKSSYFQRRNNLRVQVQYPSPETPPGGSKLLQREDSATKMSKRFENIESEWPIFVCFLIIDGIFKQDSERVMENEKLLYEKLLKRDPRSDGYLMPKYYYVPYESIDDEKGNPDSVERLPSAEGSSSDQIFLMGQAILLITRLLLAGLVHPSELDPLRRHMPSHDRPRRIGRYSSFRAISSDLVVQTILIAESIRLQAMMANYGIQTQTPLEVEPVQIWSPSQLIKVYEYLGVNEKLGLKGRPSRPIGALGTSKLYRICGQTILCYPLIFEVSDFYLAQDMLLLIDDIQNELNFIGNYWRMSGRPTVCILIREEHLRDVHFRDLLDLLVQFKNGQLKKSGLRIKTGRLQNLISSSCIEHLDFLHLLPHEHLPQFQSFRQLVESPKQSLLTLAGRGPGASASFHRRRHLCSASSHNIQAIEESGGSFSGEMGDFLQIDSEYPASTSLDVVTDLSSSIGNRSINSNDLDESYSTLPCTSIDYYECFKDSPTWPTIIDTFKSCTELSGQAQLLAILRDREGSKFSIDDLSVDERLERLSHEACQIRSWSVVRYCSSILKRSVESLSPWLTSILVCGKQISLGTGANEKIINNPLTPTEIHNLLYSTASTTNPCDAVLQQEIALYIGRLISTRPDYFDGILTIRVINFMSAMRSYLNIKTNEIKVKMLRARGQTPIPDESVERDQTSSRQLEQGENLLDLRIKHSDISKPSFNIGDNQDPSLDLTDCHKVSDMKIDPSTPTGRSDYGIQAKIRRTMTSRSGQNLIAKPLESLSPSDVRKLLVKVLNEVDSLPISDRRQITGELCRVPKDFYDKVWSLLSCTNVGIVIGGKILRSLPILANMTQDDLNFALKVESLLSEIQCPKLRQINVELLMALHVIVERNPEIRFDSDPLDLDKVGSK